MRRWWQLGTRNWRTRRGATLASLVAVAIGVAAVVSITSFHATAWRAISEQFVKAWLGASHVAIHPPGAHWGSLHVSLVEEVEAIPGVQAAAPQLRRRAFVSASRADSVVDAASLIEVDGVGVDTARGAAFVALPSLQGRSFSSGERGGAVIERELADRLEVAIGNRVLLYTAIGGDAVPFTVLGIMDSERLAEFQHPLVLVAIEDMQEMRREAGVASVIEIQLVDPTRENIRAVHTEVERLIEEKGILGQVESTAAQQELLHEAERITRLVLAFVAFIALFTAFFIILTTIGMSLHNQRSVLGMLRCIGMTRAQLSLMLFVEMLPVGLAGTLLGLLLGCSATWLVGHFVDHPFEEITLDPFGIRLALASGLITTLLSTTILAVQVLRVPPLIAVHDRARPVRMSAVLFCGAGGLLTVALHVYLVESCTAGFWLMPLGALIGTVSLFFGYVLIAPPVVMLLGRPLARAVGRVFGLHPRIAEDQFGRAPWRSSGICLMLTVGLALIVYIATRGESVIHLWNISRNLPATFVWSPARCQGDVMETVPRLPGVERCTALTDYACKIEPVGIKHRVQSVLDVFLKRLFRPVFVAGDPHDVLAIMSLGFAEGDRETAVELLEQGGYVLIPLQTSQQHDLHLGDRVRVTIFNRTAEFEIAGVVESAAFELAVNFFQAESYMQIAAASAIFGTRKDLLERFRLDEVSLLLCNLNFEAGLIPSDFERSNIPPAGAASRVASGILSWAPSIASEAAEVAEIREELIRWIDQGCHSPLSAAADRVFKRFQKAFRYISQRWSHYSAAEDWEALAERLILLRIGEAMGDSDAVVGSIARLTSFVDRNLRRATRIATWVPSVALIVAALGIGNLMMISVHARTRQIAILRAMGAQKSQIIRLVLTEATVLGLLGCMIGVGLGMHLTYSVLTITYHASGFRTGMVIPWNTVALGVVLTVGICLTAGIAPARYAARDRIMEAIAVT